MWTNSHQWVVPSKQEPPYYEAKAWRTTEEEIERMKNLFPYFRAENYRLMSASTGPIGTKSHVQASSQRVRRWKRH